MVQKKRASKRMGLHQKYKIEKRVREHNRKLRRQAKKDSHGRKMTKDPGIPNLWPYKEDLLRQMDKKEMRRKEAITRQKQDRLKKANERRSLDAMDVGDEGKMAQLVANAAVRTEAFKREEEAKVDAPQSELAVKNRRRFYRQMKQVMEKADIILEVLDARDPMGCRANAVERYVMSHSKRLVLVLNKIDLVPQENAVKWRTRLSRELPTIMFKANTQKQKGRLQHTAVSAKDESKGGALHASGCVGADVLLQLLKNYSRSLNKKKAISVGIVGYPNVGKSSLINSMKRQRAVGVSPTPGFTKAIQEVHLDRQVMLLDCPGIIFDDEDDSTHLLRNIVTVDEVEDPERAVVFLLERCKPHLIMETYTIPRFSGADEFLKLIAEKRQMRSKGGALDKLQAARSVLRDWTTGKIPYFADPPEDAATVVDATVVAEWGKEFSLAAISDAETLVKEKEMDVE